MVQLFLTATKSLIKACNPKAVNIVSPTILSFLASALCKNFEIKLSIVLYLFWINLISFSKSLHNFGSNPDINLI